jgi:diguanylate cyclase (GGDEF)-like protein/PAS domain S-box-containing protein
MSLRPDLISDLAVTRRRGSISLARRTLIVMATMICGIFLLSISVLVFFAININHQADEHTQLLMNNVWNARKNTMATRVLRHASWRSESPQDKLITNGYPGFDDKGFSKLLHDDYGYEAGFIIIPSAEHDQVLSHGEIAPAALSQWIGEKQLHKLTQQALANYGKSVVQVYQIAGQPALVSAAVIAGQQQGALSAASQDSVLVFVDMITPEKLVAMAKLCDISYPRVELDSHYPGYSSSLQITPENAPPITIYWKPVTPAQNLLHFILPMLISIAFLFAGLVYLVIRKTLIDARLSDKRFMLLHQSRQALLKSEARFRDVAQAASDWIWETDSEFNITYLSERFHEITHYPPSLWIGKRLDELLHSEEGSLTQWISLSVMKQERQLVKCYYLTQQGQEHICTLSVRRIVYDSQHNGFRGTATDITVELAAQARIQHLSLHDALTGLPNRIIMKQFLESSLAGLTSSSAPVVVLSLDLDHFKDVNDTCGHITGDAVLNQIVARWRYLLTDKNLLFRNAGDEFVLILTSMVSQAEITQFCEKLVALAKDPFFIDQHAIYIGVSIGIAIAPQDAVQTEELLRLADIALCRAKNNGRNTWVFYSPEMAQQLSRRREIEERLRKALTSNELELYYQPRYSLVEGKITSAEALLRWPGQANQRLEPDSFIPVAEQSALIFMVTDWVMRQACIDALAWQYPIVVSVNVSPLEFSGRGLVDRVARTLAETGLPAERLELEITENVIMDEPEKVQEIMMELKKLGVRLVVDDFGTGYSSLNYLRSFPFDGLKIDKSFITHFPASAKEFSVVEGIIKIGHALSLHITAEGVEQAEQLAQLKALGCHEIQGFLLGKPLPLELFNLHMSHHYLIDIKALK